MEALEAILSRRSIRRYTDQKISDELIKKMLQAAMSAPSAHNYQPWHFILIDDRKLLDQVPQFHPYAKMLKQAPLAIAVCGDLTLEKNIDYIIEDCSAASQNILLAAHALGLGAVWLGIHPRKERVDGLKKLLKTEEHILPVSLISIGYPAEQKSAEDRYNPDKVCLNVWSQKNLKKAN